ncbi:cytidine deaminase (plasmid) [Pseudoalteromonas lipolytica]|uniref:Cytidine deaminase n=1 Tax=Pseudoalteromonas lipolytica TaxID=570156 RepID=A0AAD0S328_9GAMM|nr:MULTISPECIES: cytidine deaminase [Pseudoalteromonas]AXV67172.1 cytidine deaminase [Pseudoalteromonas donghaensis]MCC9660507.1 cytidine deaminase [Pseudoalteromonas sp. MB41]QMW16550.1 cytidine deaminase [Pseudoalteromonas sp. MT33b]
MTASSKELSQEALNLASFSFSLEQKTALFTQLKQQRGILFQRDIIALCNEHKLTETQLLKACVPVASLFSVAPISQFYVGAIALGINQQGETQFYFGANVEFTHQALSLVVHAEQSAINNAWLNGAKSVIKIAISDAPCGYCRQFMNELDTADSLEILLPEKHFSLHDLLPNAFGPKDLGNEISLMSQSASTHQFSGISNACDATLIKTALNAYVPYTGNFSAVKISTYHDGDFYGSYAENAAYSPSLSPLQSALSQFYLSGLSFDDQTVKSITLLETEGAKNQLEVAKAVLASFENPPAFEYITAALIK